MAGIGFIRHSLNLSFHKVLVIVQIPVVRRHAEVLPHILTAQALLPGHQGLVELLAMPGADDICPGIPKELLYRLGQVSDGGGVRLLDEQVSRVRVLKGKADQLHRLVQVHHKPGHIGVRDGDGIPRPDLVDEQRDHRPAGAHDITVAGAADHRVAPLRGHAGVGVDDVLHHGLGDAHGVDGVRRLVCGQTHNALHPGVDGGVEHIVRADHIGLHRLHGEKLAGRDLLEGRRMEYVVNAGHGVRDGLGIAYVTDVELHFLGVVRVLLLELVAHIILLLFVPGEDSDLADVGLQKVLQYCVAKAAGAAGDHEGCVGKCAHCGCLPIFSLF